MARVLRAVVSIRSSVRMFCISCSASLKRNFSSTPACCLLDHAVAAPEDVDVLADVADLEQSRLDAVVEVGGEVGDLVGEVDQLRLERRPLIEKIVRQVRDAARRCSRASA